jgi:hypothetical protein
MLAPPLGYDPGQRVLRCWRDAGNDKSLVGLWPFWRDTIAAGVKTKWSSHRRRPSGDLEPLESLGFPYQVSLTIAVNVEPLYHPLPDGPGGPFPARGLSGREGSIVRRAALNVRLVPSAAHGLPVYSRPVCARCSHPTVSIGAPEAAFPRRVLVGGNGWKPDAQWLRSSRLPTHKATA